MIEQVEVSTPSIQSGNDVLIQVKAAGVNPIDMKNTHGIYEGNASRRNALYRAVKLRE